jgi:AcrR family transcriptional regulator
MSQSATAPRRIRERLLDAASTITARDGWSAVTMAKLADDAGVSRQTVYNEVGSKSVLAEALVMRELDRFLVLVVDEMAATDDVVEAIRAAARAIFERAERNPLLHAVLSASHGAGNDLLPLLTSHSAELIGTASAVMGVELARFRLPLPEAQLALGIDAVVRLVLSHVMQPTKSPAETADDIAWLVARLLPAA